RWQALALVATSADLVGVARGAHAVACDYAKIREQYGKQIGSYQAIAHLLAESLALIEGSVSVLRHAAWGGDELEPAQAIRAAQIAKVYCARATRTVCETAVQVHGGIGNTWECIVHVYLRRALLSSQWFGDDAVQLAALGEAGLGGVLWPFVPPPPKPSSARVCARGSPRTTRACPRRRPTTST